MSIVLPVKRFPHGENIPLPAHATKGSSGMDIRAALEKSQNLAPMERALIPTGLCITIPEGYELQVRPRSGLAWKHGITVLNAPGTIDSDYRGELKVILINLGSVLFTIKYGMRIAQLVLVKHMSLRKHIHWQEDKSKEKPLSKEKRRGGFGSTGF